MKTLIVAASVAALGLVSASAQEDDPEPEAASVIDGILERFTEGLGHAETLALAGLLLFVVFIKYLLVRRAVAKLL